jgi:hypothetical protein
MARVRPRPPLDIAAQRQKPRASHPGATGGGGEIPAARNHPQSATQKSPRRKTRPRPARAEYPGHDGRKTVPHRRRSDFQPPRLPQAAGAATIFVANVGTDVPEASDSAGSNARTGASVFSVRKECRHRRGQQSAPRRSRRSDSAAARGGRTSWHDRRQRGHSDALPQRMNQGPAQSMHRIGRQPADRTCHPYPPLYASRMRRISSISSREVL